MAARTLKKEGEEKMNVRLYKHISNKKKYEFFETRREELIHLGKNKRFFFWQELQLWKKKIENNITSNQWFDYARKVYEKKLQVEPPPRSNIATKFFTLSKVEEGIKNLKTQKEKDQVELQEENKKWGMNIMALHIMEIFNNVI